MRRGALEERSREDTQKTRRAELKERRKEEN